MAKRLPKGLLEGELTRICAYSRGIHGADGLKLPNLRRVLETYGAWTPPSDFGSALHRQLENLIGGLRIDAGLQQALRIDLAIEYAAQDIPSPDKRREIAAATAGCSLDAYQHNRAGRSARRTIALQKLAAELDPLAVLSAPSAAEAIPRRARANPSEWCSRKRYWPLEHEDMESGLWWRDSTRSYIEELATQPSLTILAGTDGPADVGPPLHSDVMVALLRDCLNDHPLLHRLPVSMRDAAANDLVRAVRSPGPSSAGAAYIGSIVRGLWQAREDWNAESVERRLHNVIQEMAHDREKGGFVSTAITRLAFALRSQGVPVSVVSAHYDSDLSSVAEQVRGRYEALRGCAYQETINSRPTEPSQKGQVPLVMLNGGMGGAHPGMLMVGEADLVDSELDPTAAGTVARARTLEELFTQASVLLVGSSLSSPGLVSAMARTRGGDKPRFALLPSPISDDMPSGAVIADDRRAELLAILAARYLYLDVVPLVVDFRYQVPQLLTEVARRVFEGDSYRDYPTRMQSWWERWRDSFGYGEQGSDGAARREAQQCWHVRLKELREELHALVPGRKHVEDLMIEVWLRDPQPASRLFFRWASSEGIWERAKTTPVAYLREVGDLTQKTFREGMTIGQPLSGELLGRWRFCIGMNLTLNSGPWADLPVGIVKIYSTLAEGGIQQLGTNFEERVEQSLCPLFDERAA